MINFTPPSYKGLTSLYICVYYKTKDYNNKDSLAQKR